MTAKSQDAVRRAYELGGKTPPDMRPPAGLTGYIRKLSQHNQTPAMDVGASTASLTTPKTKADYDALPSGAQFINDEDGKTYRKP